MSKLVITVGETVETANQRLFQNVRRAKAGEPVEADARINFADAKTMFTMLNGNRFDVLTFVADHHPKSINAIATGLGRGYRRVHEDVQALLNLGLIDRQDDGSLSVGFNPETLSIEVAV
jgi:predicted transcriptional regulator